MIATAPVKVATANEQAAERVHAYSRDVVAGTVIANRYVRLLCERHLRWLDRTDLRFDADKAGKGIRFFSMLRLHEGDFEGKPFNLQPWQAFIVGSIEGWHIQDEDGSWYRLIRNAYIETAKGSGKTPMAAGMGILGMVIGKSGAQIYAAAAGRDQSAIPWNDARLMVEKSETLRALVKSMAHALVGPKGSSFTYCSSEAKNLHGKRVFRAIIDEEHAHPGPEVIDAMRLGTKAWRDALIMRITNSGFDRHSVCWQDHQYSINVLEGVLDDDSWFGYVCGLDMCDEHRPNGAPVDGCAGCDQWTDERVWAKANPNLGVSLPRQYLRETVREALGKPAQQSITKRLNFCIWTEGSGKWLDAPAFVGAKDTAGPDRLPVTRRGYAGLDLSESVDLTALAFVAPRRTCVVPDHASLCYDLRVRFWLPTDNMAARIKRDHVPYDVWVRDGWIELTPGNWIDRRWILRELIEMREQVIVLGYDRFGMDQLRLDLEAAGYDGETEGFLLPVGQGFASLSAPAKRLSGDIAKGLAHHDGNPVLSWMVANAVADQDAAGNIKPDKARSSEKIDGVSAWCDALFAWAGAEPEPMDSAYAGLTEDQIVARMLGLDDDPDSDEADEEEADETEDDEVLVQ